MLTGQTTKYDLIYSHLLNYCKQQKEGEQVIVSCTSGVDGWGAVGLDFHVWWRFLLWFCCLSQFLSGWPLWRSNPASDSVTSPIWKLRFTPKWNSPAHRSLTAASKPKYFLPRRLQNHIKSLCAAVDTTALIKLEFTKFVFQHQCEIEARWGDGCKATEETRYR